MSIDPEDREARLEFIERSESGDPIRDWYDESDLVDSLRMAYAYIEGMERGLDIASRKSK